MKKVQRSFAVEYKSGRRRPDIKSNSIWGNLDLKSVARDVEEATPFPSTGSQGGKSGNEANLPQAKQAEALLTPQVEDRTTVLDKQEMIIADEIETATDVDAPAIVETPISPKKQRKPRAKKVTPETASVEAAAEPAMALGAAAGKQKRGRRAKAVEDAGSAKRTLVKRAPTAVQTAIVVPTATVDEMADLLQLEEENQRLRKLLAEKLRAENADLRKRLKLD